MTENGLYQVMQYAHPFDANPKISEIVEWYDDDFSYEEKCESEAELIRIEEVTEND